MILRNVSPREIRVAGIYVRPRGYLELPDDTFRNWLAMSEANGAMFDAKCKMIQEPAPLPKPKRKPKPKIRPKPQAA